jgi:N-acetylneuraminate lyase
MEKTFKGILPAIVSPCDEYGVFLGDQFAHLAAGLYKEGVNGLYICGTTGDGRNMRVVDRKIAAEIAVRVSKDFGGAVIVQVGGCAPDDSMYLAEHAARTGADAVACFPPASCEHKFLPAFYADIAKACGLGVFFYHYPATTHFYPTYDQLLELLDVKGVVGLKFTDIDLMLEKQLLFARPKITLFHAFEESILTALLYGASGCIGAWSNLFPGLFVRMYQAVSKGDLKTAFSLQDSILPLLAAAKPYGWLNVVEYLMCKRGLASRCFREPHVPLDSAACKILDDKLKGPLRIINNIYRQEKIK